MYFRINCRFLKSFVCAVLALMTLASYAAGDDESSDVEPQRAWVFVGTYTRGKSEGIYVLELDLATGKVSKKSVVVSKNPSFVAVHPDGKALYAVNEIGDYRGTITGAVSAFSIDQKSGSLTAINQQSSRGAAPCHLVVDKTGRFVLVANYSGGSVCSLPIGDGGRLKPAISFVQHSGFSVNPQRQKGPHAHSINLAPDNRLAVAADLGIDKALIYRFDSDSGELVTNAVPSANVAPGSGPRHFAFHPSGKFGYMINELSLDVTAFTIDSDAGTLSKLQVISTLPPGTERIGSTAEVQVHPNGRFLYGSNRGHDSVVVYLVNQGNGRLTYVENESTGGETPRNFGIDPTGNLLLAANQATNNIVVFRIDQRTGELSPTGHQIDIPSPVCVKFLLRP